MFHSDHLKSIICDNCNKTWCRMLQARSAGRQPCQRRLSAGEKNMFCSDCQQRELENDDDEDTQSDEGEVKAFQVTPTFPFGKQHSAAQNVGDHD